MHNLVNDGIDVLSVVSFVRLSLKMFFFFWGGGDCYLDETRY